ncbi:unnamed protein product [Adineta ricciae]|uniref:Uncharacterized protein n=1 Tax=Adineta ricciae TaxID=249248 RepID=A0A815SV48_ADIRI|nr:unnamed protein product [Adineta ricciae]CAF1498649.1 unnamed protein product [Adineta ricciae]
MSTENKYFLELVFTKDAKYVFPFSRREINLDLDSIIDKYQAAVSIGFGAIDIIMSDTTNTNGHNNSLSQDTQNYYLREYTSRAFTVSGNTNDTLKILIRTRISNFDDNVEEMKYEDIVSISSDDIYQLHSQSLNIPDDSQMRDGWLLPTVASTSMITTANIINTAHPIVSSTINEEEDDLFETMHKDLFVIIVITRPAILL